MGLALGVSACAAEEVPEPLPDSNPYGSFDVDPPAPGEIILTVEGAAVADLSLEDLKELPVTTVTVLEPFVQEVHTYDGVLLETLFDIADVDLAADVDTIALNDYRFQDGATALVDAGAILAYAEDGDAIPMDRGGPVRLVFPEDSEYFTYLDAWNWSLRTILEIQE